MIEILYTILVLFGFIFPFFFLFKEFKPLKLGLIFFQWIISVILLSDNFYKDQSLYEDPNFNNIQNIDFKPIISLYKIFYENGSFENISFDTMNNSEFSLIKTQKYSVKCFENYYITTNKLCPITDIIFEKNRNKIYQNYIQIYDDEYLYYTNENKLGKLYKSFNYYKFKENIDLENKNDKIYNHYIEINENEYIYYTKENNFSKLYKQFNYSDFKLYRDYNVFSLDKIIRKEFNKLSNPIYTFKSYIKFCDVLCFLLILFSFFHTFFESLNIKKCDILRIFNNCSQLIIIILHIIRYIKFIDVKKFFFDNEDIYNIDKEDYFPNKVFNIDSFPLAISINIFIFYFLCICFPNKPSCCKIHKCRKCCEINFDIEKDYGGGFLMLTLVISIYIEYFTLSIIDISNDRKIIDVYNNMIYNWDMNPILSIKKKNNNDGSKSDFIWKKDSFIIERLNNFDYINIYPKKNGKICGKDNYGNNLYFPSDVDCPINEIYFSDKNEDFIGYKKIELNNGKYLYYTNAFVEKISLSILESVLI